MIVNTVVIRPGSPPERLQPSRPPESQTCRTRQRAPSPACGRGLGWGHSRAAAARFPHPPL